VLDLAAEPEPEEILAFDEAISRLESETPDAARVVRLRFYGGLTVEQTAEAMGVSSRTVHREWTYARAWLFRELEPGAREQGVLPD
jgi:RNA polymerase sigma factor (sigma-70 family)